jgi:cell division protein ZipA
MQYVDFEVLGVILIVFILFVVIKIKRRKTIAEEDNFSVEESSDFLDDAVIAVRKKGEVEKKTEPKLTSHEARVPNDIVILYVIAKTGKTFAGYELLQILLSLGLRFGDMNIFHYYQNTDDQENVLFSLASATEPGTFDLLNMDTFSCKGLSLFMRKTGDSEEDSMRYTMMLETAVQLSDDLAGYLLNGQKQLIANKQEAVL